MIVHVWIVHVWMFLYVCLSVYICARSCVYRCALSYAFTRDYHQIQMIIKQLFKQTPHPLFIFKFITIELIQHFVYNDLAQVCPPLRHPENGFLQIKGNTNVYLILAGCNPGFIFSDGKTAKIMECTMTSRWNDTLTNCTGW